MLTCYSNVLNFRSSACCKYKVNAKILIENLRKSTLKLSLQIQTYGH
jgi:hypothetical protein